MKWFPAASATRVVTDRQETEESRDSLGQPSVGSRHHAALRLERENRLVVQGLNSTIQYSIDVSPTELIVLTFLEQAVFETIPVWLT